jgi:hypothetical protein
MDTARENTTAADPIAAIDAFLNRSDLEVKLTYAFAPEPIVFPVRLMMNDDEINARQAFYAQPAAAQESGRHKYHVEMLCSILSGCPSGLPGFKELHSAAPPADASPEKVLKSYLMRGGNVAEMIANDAIELYNRMIKPAEFFR